MNFDPCKICGTPGVKVEGKHQTCPGCGVSLLRDVALWVLNRERKPIDLFTVTLKHRTSRSDMSLGSWVMVRGFKPKPEARQ